MKRVIKFFKGLVAEYKRVRYINKGLKNLEDPTFLDRVVRGENER